MFTLWIKPIKAQYPVYGQEFGKPEIKHICFYEEGECYWWQTTAGKLGFPYWKPDMTKNNFGVYFPK